MLFGRRVADDDPELLDCAVSAFNALELPDSFKREGPCRLGPEHFGTGGRPIQRFVRGDCRIGLEEFRLLRERYPPRG